MFGVTDGSDFREGPHFELMDVKFFCMLLYYRCKKILIVKVDDHCFRAEAAEAPFFQAPLLPLFTAR